jgi:hypothetical protein
MSKAWGVMMYERPTLAGLGLQSFAPELATEVIKSTADRVFLDVHENGFSKDLCLAYNMLISAARYLETGQPMVASRARVFFTEGAPQACDCGECRAAYAAEGKLLG